MAFAFAFKLKDIFALRDRVALLLTEVAFDVKRIEGSVVVVLHSLALLHDFLIGPVLYPTQVYCLLAFGGISVESFRSGVLFDLCQNLFERQVLEPPSLESPL